MTREELRELGRNLSLLGIELSLFDSSSNCTGGCSSNGQCTEDLTECECTEGFHLRDCSLTTSDYERFLGLKMRVYSLTRRVSSQVSDSSISQQLMKMKSKISRGGALMEKMTGEELRTEVATIREILDSEAAQLDFQSVFYLISPENSTYQQDLTQITEEVLTQTELLDNLLSSVLKPSGGIRRVLEEREGASLAELLQLAE